MTVMTQDNTTKWKQSLIRMIAGGVVGMAAAAAMLGLMGGGLIDAMGPSRVALAAVGLIYCLMAALVGFGLAAPRAGAQLLNVADADELREERSGMLLSVVTMGGIGIVLITLLAWVVFKQKLDLPAVVGMGMILAGVLVINLYSKAVV